MSPPTVHIYSKRNDEGQPALGDCQLVVGDGTTGIVFKGGMAQNVPLKVARLVAHRTDLDFVPPLSTFDENAGAVDLTATDEHPAGRSDPQLSDELKAAAELLESHGIHVGGGEQPGGPTDPTEPVLTRTEAPPKPGRETVTEEQRQARIAAAKAHLADEGIEVPETADGGSSEVAITEPEPPAEKGSADPSQGADEPVDAERFLAPEEVPEGVVPGETPGWPTDAESGRALRLTDEQRAELANAKLEADPPEPEAQTTEPAAAERVLPQGFANKTDDDELRCLASKRDGTQCKNACKDGTNACALGQHQAAVAA